MKNIIIVCAICMFIALAGAKSVVASPVLIDFESTGLSEGDTITTEIPGLTFTNSIIAEEGSPGYAFGNQLTGERDTALAGEPFGGLFITDPLVGGDYTIPGIIEISFDIPVFDLSFRVADLDGPPSWPAEVFTGKAFDVTGTLLQTITITAGHPGTGDGIATLVQFDASDISHLTLTVDQETDSAGWGVDNLSYTPVPIPGALLLFSSGLIGLLGFRKKLKN